MQQEARGIPQTGLMSMGALDICGIIYAVVHISTGRIYIGQTVHSAYIRFKQHWNGRKSSASPLSRWMCQSGNIADFAVFPLERIDDELYMDNNRNVLRWAFLRAATPRELFWIRRCRSRVPKGGNVMFPKALYNRPANHRRPPKVRANNSTHLPLEPRSRLSVSASCTIVDISPGRYLSIRQKFAHVLGLYHDRGEWKKYLESLSRRHLLLMRFWLADQVPYINLQEDAKAVDTALRQLLVPDRSRHSI
jgi:hypothetical protein